MVNKSTIKLIEELSNHISITRICQILGLSRSTYYRHLKLSQETIKFSELEDMVHQLCIKTHFLYGYRKIFALLKKQKSEGFSVSKIQRIMAKYDWGCSVKVKNFHKPGNLYKTFENIINRDWITTASCQKLTTDIKYLPFGKSMLYLSTIMDTFNSEIIAFEISDRPDTKLATDTLEQLCDLPDGTILHSDQGSTYTSKDFFDLARKKGVTRSMSRKGTPADNALIESFHSCLKVETFYNHKEPIGSNNIVIEMVKNYISFWNNKRIFTKLGNQSPVDYRKSVA